MHFNKNKKTKPFPFLMIQTKHGNVDKTLVLSVDEYKSVIISKRSAKPFFTENDNTIPIQGNNKLRWHTTCIPCRPLFQFSRLCFCVEPSLRYLYVWFRFRRTTVRIIYRIFLNFSSKFMVPDYPFNSG